MLGMDPEYKDRHERETIKAAAVEAERRGNIERRLHMLGDMIGVLDEQVDLLEQRLGGVLTPIMEKSDGSTEEGFEQVESTLAQTLEVMAARLGRSLGRVSQIRSRVDL